MNLTNAMRPAYAKRFSFMNAIRRVARENIYGKSTYLFYILLTQPNLFLIV